MSLKDVCNADMLVKFDNTVGPGDLVYTGDVGIDPVKVKPTLSIKNQAVSKQVATTGVVIVWASAANQCPHTSATHTFISGGGAIAVSALKVRCENQLVLRKDDVGTCVGSWQPPSGPPVVCNCDVEISNAGQTKVKAA